MKKMIALSIIGFMIFSMQGVSGIKSIEASMWSTIRGVKENMSREANNEV